MGDIEAVEYIVANNSTFALRMLRRRLLSMLLGSALFAEMTILEMIIAISIRIAGIFKSLLIIVLIIATTTSFATASTTTPR